MRICILCIGIVDIVGGNQIDSCFLMHAKQLLVYILLFRDAVILKLQEKVPLAENILIAKRSLLSILIKTSVNKTSYFTSQAGA